ncbi:MAG: hypothetical protein KC592_13405 [Nitrospira sp.]|nr:hypothetical protein [Nitrospira sp.]HBP89318.1 hypothetical protein [Nitrospiraceae bacterium]HNP31145.1 hypothetical protein [Nitrospirales bacterium]
MLQEDAIEVAATTVGWEITLSQSLHALAWLPEWGSQWVTQDFSRWFALTWHLVEQDLMHSLNVLLAASSILFPLAALRE